MAQYELRNTYDLYVRKMSIKKKKNIQDFVYPDYWSEEKANGCFQYLDMWLFYVMQLTVYFVVCMRYILVNYYY